MVSRSVACTPPAGADGRAFYRLKARVSCGEESAWKLYIKRLSDGLLRACALREAVRTAAKIDESANEELGQTIADVFCVVRYMPADEA